MTGGGPARIAACFAIWSTWSIFTRWLSLPGWAITLYVGIVVCSCVGGYSLLTGPRGNRTETLRPAHLGALVAMGLLFMCNNLFYLTSVKLTTVANAIFTHYLAPVLVGIGAPLFLREKRLRSAPLVLALATVGMGLLVGPGLEASVGGTHVPGLVLGTLSAVAYAGLLIMSRHYAPRMSTATFIFYPNLVVVLGVLPWMLYKMGSGGVAAQLPVGRDWWMLAVLGVIHGSAAVILYVTGIRRTSAQLASILGYIEPLLAVAMAAVLFDEKTAAAGLAGGALILLGGGLAAWEEAVRQARAQETGG